MAIGKGGDQEEEEEGGESRGEGGEGAWEDPKGGGMGANGCAVRGFCQPMRKATPIGINRDRAAVLTKGGRRYNPTRELGGGRHGVLGV